jgi:hypothetical protein
MRRAKHFTFMFSSAACIGLANPEIGLGEVRKLISVRAENAAFGYSDSENLGDVVV